MKCYGAMNCQLKCQYMSSRLSVILETQNISVHLEHHNLSTIPETLVTFPSTQC